MNTVGTSFTDAEARNVLDSVLYMLLRSLHRRLQVPATELRAHTVVLSASTVNKLSFHIITPVLLDSHATSGAVLAYEIGLAIRQHVIQECRLAISSRRLIMLQAAGVGKGSLVFDMVPYGRNQLFRLPGNRKGGQDRPLRAVGSVHIATGDASTPLIATNTIPFSFTAQHPSAQSFLSYLVQGESAAEVRNSQGSPFVVKACESFPWNLPGSERRAGRHRDDLQKRTVGAAVDAATASLARPEMTGYLNSHSHRVQQRMPLTSHILEDSAAIVLDDGCTNIQFQYLTSGQTVFCPSCETLEVDRSGGPALLGKGKASGSVAFSTTGHLAIHCFSCGLHLFAASTFKRELMSVTADETITFTDPNWRINSHGRKDVIIAPHCRILAISATTGLGKSHFVARLLDDREDDSVLALSYREALARYQSREWSLTDYKEEGAFHGNAAKRISCCVNSVVSLPYNGAYDIVIMDEADAIRLSLGDSTMDERFPQVYRRLQQLLRGASLILLLQADLSEDVLAWVADAADVDADDRNLVQRHCFRSPKPLYPLAECDDVGDVVALLARFYRVHWDEGRQCLKVPLIVFCTQASFANALHALLIQHIACTEEGKSRIRLVTAHTHSSNIWVKNFIRNPNEGTAFADVVVSSPVLAAGISIDCHYKAAFYFLHAGILTHDQEFQMTQRLRVNDMSSMHPYVYAYIQPGLADAGQANRTTLVKAYSPMVEAAGLSAGMDDRNGIDPGTSVRLLIQAEQKAERADTKNRHAWKWSQRYKAGNHIYTSLRKVTDSTMLAIEDGSEQFAKEAKSLLQKYLRSRSKAVDGWFLDNPLEKVEELAEGNLHVDISDQILFECNAAKEHLIVAVRRSGRFTQGAQEALAAAKIQEQTTSISLNWVACFLLGRWLDFALYRCKRRTQTWLLRCSAVAKGARHAASLASVELLGRLVSCLSLPTAEDSGGPNSSILFPAGELGFPDPGMPFDLHPFQGRILAFRAECALPWTDEGKLWTASGLDKLTTTKYTTAYKFLKSVLQKATAQSLQKYNGDDGRGETPVVVSKQTFATSILTLLATRQVEIAQHWLLLDSSILTRTVEGQLQTFAQWLNESSPMVLHEAVGSGDTDMSTDMLVQ